MRMSTENSNKGQFEEVQEDQTILDMINDYYARN